MMTWICYVVHELLLNFDLSFLEYQIFAYYSFPYILNVFHDCLEVRGCIIGASDENVVCFAGCCRHIQRRDGDKSEEDQHNVTTEGYLNTHFS